MQTELTTPQDTPQRHPDMRTATLPADLYETDEALLLLASLPGVKAEDLEVQLDGDRLTVTATRHEPVPSPAAEGVGDDTVTTPLFRELGDVRWQRSFRLRTAVDADAIEARLEAGELTITLPKAPELRPRTIEVKAG